MPAVFPCNVCNNIIVTLYKRQRVNIECHATPATPCIYFSLLTNTNQSSSNRDQVSVDSLPTKDEDLARGHSWLLFVLYTVST
jgi:hypothetical protein